jgi:hypothetical protein
LRQSGRDPRSLNVEFGRLNNSAARQPGAR